jgi:hypothetical protein
MNVWDEIKDLMARPKEVGLPWTLPPLKQSSPMPGVCFFTAGGIPMQPPQCVAGLIIPREATEEMPYNDAHEIDVKILFTLDSWQIECYDEVDNNFNECDWISHYCPTYGWRYRIDQWQIMSDECCPECCIGIPDEVLGVWKLKNMDKLPSPDDARMINHALVHGSSNPREIEEDTWK